MKRIENNEIKKAIDFLSYILWRNGQKRVSFQIFFTMYQKRFRKFYHKKRIYKTVLN